MRKRILSLLLALMLVIGTIPAQANATELNNGLQYEIYDEHVVITRYTGFATEVVIPDEIEGKSVTTIGEQAFEGHKNLTSVILPSRLQEIGFAAFSGCSSLTSIALPDSLTNIRGNAFENCTSLTSINIPNSVTSISRYAFSNCDNLITVNIPASVTDIGESAFYHCDSLISIHVDENNTSYCSMDGALFDKEMTELLCCPGGKQGTFIVPSSMSSRSYVTMDAFDGCSNLTSILVEEGNEYFSSYDGILYNKDMTHLRRCPGGKRGNITLAASLKQITGEAFEDCLWITDVNIPDGVTRIEWSAFRGCTSLSNITFPDSLTVIEDTVFEGCISLKSVNLPSKITRIWSETFIDCINLSCIVIPSKTTQIGWGAFWGCASLNEIRIPSSVTEIVDYAFAHTGLTSISFEGNAPLIYDGVFHEVCATAYYPSDNPTWTADVMQNYGGTITWVPYNPNNPFTDVPIGSFYESPVLWALENGITTGASADSFNPSGECLRAQVVTFLHRAAENPEPTSTVNPFADVKSTDFFYTPVLWAVEKGITNGISATEFGSYDVCNRAAVVTFLWRAAGSPEPESAVNPFTDVKPTDFFYKPVLWAVENGITNGLSATEFGPASACNRAQVVTFLYRAWN